MGGFCLLVKLHREGSAPAACAADLFLDKGVELVDGGSVINGPTLSSVYLSDNLFQILINASIFSDYSFLLSSNRFKTSCNFPSSVGWSVHQTIGPHFVWSPKELLKEGLSPAWSY